MTDSKRQHIKRIVLCCLCAAFLCKMFAQSSADIEAYIAKYRNLALEQEREFGIPATITLAQGILESGAGKSGLTRVSNNHFGIKRGSNWSGPTHAAWDDEPQKSSFRVYASAEESFRDHSLLLQKKRYRHLFDKSVFDYRGWAIGLQLAGYATSPTYAKALIGYIDAYQLYAINGGVKLRPGRTITITKTITVEELVERIDIQIPENEESEEEKSVSNTILHNGIIVEINNVRCTIIYPGETLASVSMKYDIPQSKLLEFNETTNSKDIKEGDIVFLEKKKKKYIGALDYYRVHKGETLYQISQQFGIRVSNLAKMNNLSIFSTLSEGQKLILH